MQESLMKDKTISAWVNKKGRYCGRDGLRFGVCGLLFERGPFLSGAHHKPQTTNHKLPSTP